jgi:serine/threonine protein kinase
MLVDEAEVMIEMKHERIVELFDIDIASISLIMEFMEMGSLQSVISKNKKMHWLDRYQIMLDIAEGMAFLHANTNADGTPKKRVFHQDLKSGNILLTMTNGKVRGKIGDFGLASEFLTLNS